MKKARLAVFVTLAISLLAVLLSFLISVPKGNDSFDFYSNLTLALATALFSIGASVVIVMGFGAFTKQFRRAYTIMFVGLIIWGLGYLQLPLMVMLDQLENDVFISATVVPFIASVMLIFVGTRMLAKLFNLKSITTKWWFALGVIIVIGTVVTVLPHAATTSDEMEFDMVNALIMAASTFFAICAYNILLIKRQAGVAFTNAFAWLCISMFVTAFMGGYGSTFVLVAFGDAALRVINILAIAPSFLGAALFLRSAYSFNKIVDSADVQGLSVARSFFGKPLTPRSETEAITSVDIVTYTAGLVSNPGDIDSLLDDVRMVTSHLQKGQQIQDNDEQRLKTVYLQLEDYLTHKESLRLFTKDTLRQDVAQKLRLTAGVTGTFWPKLDIGPDGQSGPGNTPTDQSGLNLGQGNQLPAAPAV